MPALAVSSRRESGRVVLVVSGELDYVGAVEMHTAATDALADDAFTAVDVELGGVTFLDSSGLGALVDIRNAALAADAIMRVIAAQPGPLRVIEVAGLAEIFGIAPR